MPGVLCPVLVGRDAELGTLTSALQDAAHGDGSLVFLTGEEGAGKSRLAAAACEHAAALGFRVLTGRGSTSADPVPYRPLAEALIAAARTGLDPGMPAASCYRRALGSLVPEWSAPGDASADLSPVIVGEAVLRLLTAPGAKGSLLVVEDLRLADPETLAVIEYLADNISSSSALCVITARGGSSASTPLLHTLPARRVATTIEVPRLRPAEVSAMAAACLGTGVLPDTVAELLSDCDGLPFAVEEVLAAAVSSGELARDDATGGWHVRADVATAVPGSIASSVHDRLSLLGPEATRVLRSAAVLGRQFDWEMLPAIAAVGEQDTLDILRRACDVQLTEPGPDDAGAGTFRFRHSLTREAILAGLMPLEIAALAAAAATAVEQAHPEVPGIWCELAAQLHRLAGQPAIAARLLATSGHRALQRGAVSSALQALGSARVTLAGAPDADPELSFDIDEDMLEGLAQAGDYKRLVPLADELITRLQAAGADPRRQALVRLTAARTRPEEHLAAATEHLAGAAAIAGQLHDAELTTRIDAAAAQCAMAAGDADKAEQLARSALGAAESAGLTEWAVPVALESLELIGRLARTQDLGAARHAFERSRQIADSTQLGTWPLRARHELATIDMLQDGTAAPLRRVGETAAEVGAASVGAMVSLQLANMLSLSTDLDQAAEYARQSQLTAARIKATRMEAFAIFLEASTAAIRGDQRAAVQISERAEALLPDDAGLLHASWGLARVLAALFRDDIGGALEADTIADPWTTRAVHYPGAEQRTFTAMLAPRRTLALHALLAAAVDRDATAAIGQARANGASASWNVGCLGYAEAIMAGRAGDTARASALAEEGSRAFEPFAPWWNHLARRLVSPAALRDGWGEPAQWLREAAAGLEVSGHHQLATACRSILRGAGERVPRAGRGHARVPAQQRRLGITSREMDVYLLVAVGESNAAIAQKLYISPKTVQTHIASLLAKTGTACKRELVAHAARAQPELAIHEA